MGEAIRNLFASRKFLVMLLTNVLVVVGALTGKISADRAAELAGALVSVWMAAHAHEEKSKVEANAAWSNPNSDAEPVVPSYPALPQNAGPSSPGVQ